MSFADRPRGAETTMVSDEGERGELPRHGFQGNRAPPPAPTGVPASLTIAVTREAGSRGNTIGSRAGLKLGWPVYNQELLEYVAQEAATRASPADNLHPAAQEWIDARLEQLRSKFNFGQHPSMAALAKLLLSLGCHGAVVLIGRGAGFILPAASTLHVRVVAPTADRIAYMSQWLRLTREQATEQVRIRDQRRADFLRTHFRRQPEDVYQYDLVLNSSLLGEDICADLIVRAARAKLAVLQGVAPTRATEVPLD